VYWYPENTVDMFDDLYDHARKTTRKSCCEMSILKEPNMTNFGNKELRQKRKSSEEVYDILVFNEPVKLETRVHDLSTSKKPKVKMAHPSSENTVDMFDELYDHARKTTPKIHYKEFNQGLNQIDKKECDRGIFVISVVALSVVFLVIFVAIFASVLCKIYYIALNRRKKFRPNKLYL
jgi:hypothetical protein